MTVSARFSYGYGGAVKVGMILLGFSVLPSTLEGTQKVPMSGEALRRYYAGDVTVVKPRRLFVGACRPVLLFLSACAVF